MIRIAVGTADIVGSRPWSSMPEWSSSSKSWAVVCADVG
jgi:hypothetical protein